jgi:hypothetical protein
MPGFNPGITVFEPSLPSIASMPGSERAYDKRSHMLIYAGAVTCGVLAAMALQIYLSGAGFDLGALWEGLLAAKGRQLRTTGPWWAIAGTAFAVGGATAAALSRLPFPWRRFRPLRWALGAVIVLLLAHVGHTEAAGADSLGPGANVAVRLAALGLAGLMAMFGAYLAVRR